MVKPTKSNTVGKTPEFIIVRKPRKVSQAEFKRIMQFCKENNLGHLTASQAIMAWDDYCEFVTP